MGEAFLMNYGNIFKNSTKIEKIDTQITNISENVGEWRVFIPSENNLLAIYSQARNGYLAFQVISLSNYKINYCHEYRYKNEMEDSVEELPKEKFPLIEDNDLIIKNAPLGNHIITFYEIS